MAEHTTLPRGLHHDPATGQWWVRTQALADIVLRDDHIGMTPERSATEPPGADDIPTVAQFFELWYRRGANHPTFKYELRNAYNANAVTPFAPGFEALAVERARSLPADGDLVDSFIAPYCLDSTFQLMGFPAEQWPSLTKAYHVLMFVIRQRFRGAHELNDRHRKAFESTMLFLRAAVAGLVERGTTPLVRAFRDQAEADGDVPWADAATIGQLLAAGVPQVNTGVAVAVRALFTEAGVLDRVRRGELDVEQVAEEAMRLHPPFLTIFGWTSAPCDCLGVRLDPGTAVVVDIAAVNSDPDRVAEPAAFCPVRGKGANYTFGKGAHYCLGAGSARVQIAAALRGLLSGDRDLAVDGSALRLDSDGFSQTAKALPYSLR